MLWILQQRVLLQTGLCAQQRRGVHFITKMFAPVGNVGGDSLVQEFRRINGWLQLSVKGSFIQLRSHSS